MMDAFTAYAGFLNAAAMGLLLLIIVAFYIRLTMEAFRNAGEDRLEAQAFNRGRADIDRRPVARAVMPAAVPVRYRLASSAA